MFLARGKDTSRVMTIEDMLSYRDAYSQPLSDFNFDNIMIEAMRASQPAPVATLVSSENAFKHVDAKTLSDEQQYRRKIQVLLNKLTESNADILIAEILDEELLNDDNISIVVELIFDKALDEPFFLTTYVKLIAALAKFENAQNPEGAPAASPTTPTSPNMATPTATSSENKSKVRRSLINKSQMTFEAQLNVDTTNMSEEEVDRRRRQEVANVKFVAELLNNGLLAFRVFNGVIQHIFATPPVDLHVELGLMLVEGCGKKIDEGGPEVRATKKYHPTDCFKYIEAIAAPTDKPPAGISLRIWFLAKNLVERRANKWASKAPKPEPVAAPTPAPAPASAAKAAAARDAEAVRRAKEAQPPEWLSDAMKKDAVRIATKDLVRPKDEEADAPAINYDAIMADLTGLYDNAGVLPPIRRRAIIVPVIKAFCASSKEAVREALYPLFKLVSSADFCLALCWALADAIMCRESEDTPKFFERFAHLLVEVVPKLAVTDVFPRASLFLDSLEKEEGDEEEWRVDYHKAYDLFVKIAKEKNVAMPPADKILDAFAKNLTNFSHDMIVDLVVAVVDPDAMAKWVNSASTEKARALADELSLFC